MDARAYLSPFLASAGLPLQQLQPIEPTLEDVFVALVSSAGVFWFGVPMRGSLVLLFSCLLVYLLSVLSLGLFISTISRTQQQALVTTFFFTFPIILLSGFIFPIANMPRVIQYVTYVNPLRYFLVIIKAAQKEWINPGA